MVSRCFPGGYNVKLYISRGRLAWWLLAFLSCVPCPALRYTMLHSLLKTWCVIKFCMLLLIMFALYSSAYWWNWTSYINNKSSLIVLKSSLAAFFHRTVIFFRLKQWFQAFQNSSCIWTKSCMVSLPLGRNLCLSCSFFGLFKNSSILHRLGSRTKLILTYYGGWRGWDSNLRTPACESPTLPLC